MPIYTCDECDMSIEPLVCAKCNEELEHKTVKLEGKSVRVCQCPNGCGQIKSPRCCDQDMVPEAD